MHNSSCCYREEKRSKALNNRWKTIETSIRNIDEVDEKGEMKKNAHWAELNA